MDGRKTGSKCTACGGDIVAVTDTEFNPIMGPPIIGPGSKQQFSEVTSYHCGNCGIMYAFLPKVKSSPKSDDSHRSSAQRKR